MFAHYFDEALALGAQYNVDPLLFAIIYLAGIPIFFGVSAWMAYRAKNTKPITLQIVLLGYLLVQPYLYVILFGQGVPAWVYLVIAVLVLGGAWSLRKKVRAVTG